MEFRTLLYPRAEHVEISFAREVIYRLGYAVCRDASNTIRLYDERAGVSICDNRVTRTMRLFRFDVYQLAYSQSVLRRGGPAATEREGHGEPWEEGIENIDFLRAIGWRLLPHSALPLWSLGRRVDNSAIRRANMVESIAQTLADDLGIGGDRRLADVVCDLGLTKGGAEGLAA